MKFKRIAISDNAEVSVVTEDDGDQLLLLTLEKAQRVSAELTKAIEEYKI